MNANLNTVLDRHSSFQRLSNAATADLHALFSAQEEKVQSLRRTVSAKTDQVENIIEAYDRLLQNLFQPHRDTVFLADQDQETVVEVSLADVIQFSPTLGNAFTGNMKEAQLKRYTLSEVNGQTLIVLATAMTCPTAQWDRLNILQDCDADDLAHVMLACEYLQAQNLFDAAFDRLLKASNSFSTVDTSLAIMRHASTSVWKDKWQKLENRAADTIAQHAGTIGVHVIDSSALCNLESYQFDLILLSVERLSNTLGSCSQILPTSVDNVSLQRKSFAEPAVVSSTVDGATVQIPVRTAMIRIDRSTLLPIQWQIDAGLRSVFDTLVLTHPRTREAPVDKRISMKLADAETLSLSLLKIRMERASPSNEIWETDEPFYLHWTSYPSSLHLQCALVLHRHGITLSEAGDLVASDAPSDNQSAAALLGYTVQSFTQLSSSPALLEWPPQAIRRLAEQAKAEKQHHGDDDLPLLKFVLAWVRQKDSEAAAAASEQQAGPGAVLLEELVGSVDLGWGRALEDDGGLTAEEQQAIQRSPSFKRIVRTALSQHYAQGAASKKRRRSSSSSDDCPLSTLWRP